MKFWKIKLYFIDQNNPYIVALWVSKDDLLL